MKHFKLLNVRDLKIGDKVQHEGLVVSHRRERQFHVIGFDCGECTEIHYDKCTEAIGFSNVERVS